MALNFKLHVFCIIIYFNYLLESSKTVEMCLKTMFLFTCHHQFVSF